MPNGKYERICILERKKEALTNINSLMDCTDQWSFLKFVYMQYMGEVGANFEVYRNDEITVEEIKK
jgi:hypothetical protein